MLRPRKVLPGKRGHVLYVEPGCTLGRGYGTCQEIFRKCSIEKGFGARTSRILEKNPFCASSEFDLTELRVPTIIMCTSLLWRANKPGKATRAVRMAPKYIFVTGGVVSSLGKGVAASSIGCLLESRGFKVT